MDFDLFFWFVFGSPDLNITFSKVFSRNVEEPPWDMASTTREGNFGNFAKSCCPRITHLSSWSLVFVEHLL